MKLLVSCLGVCAIMARHPNASASSGTIATPLRKKKLSIINWLDLFSPLDTVQITMSYFSNLALPSEPEGWDAAEVLELTNPATKRWSCPTMTLRNRRCENVVSQERSIKVKAMINAMAIEDVTLIVRDENGELTDLAKAMLCPRHASDGDKVRGVVALYKTT